MPIIIYSLMGFELMNSAGSAIRHPKRDVPKMVIISGAAIVAVYMFASFGILASLKLKDLSIVTGIADAMKLLVHQRSRRLHAGSYDIFMIGLLFTLFGNMVTWTMGSSHSYATPPDWTRPLPASSGMSTSVTSRPTTPSSSWVSSRPR